jgi:dihydroorotate dehydrogenase
VPDLFAAAARPLLFRLDPERAHDLALGSLAAAAPVLGRTRRPPDGGGRLAQDVLGHRFPNPVGLAAGFDKRAGAVPAWPALGFGFSEVGTITAQAQPGNPRPRLFRLPDDRALINRLGFNNDGAEAAARALGRWRAQGLLGRAPLGVNLGKSRATPAEDAPADYARSLDVLHGFADYVTVNVSSPNTPGLRGLQELDRLAPLLEAVRDAAGGVPVLVKIAPDLSDDAARRIAALVVRLGLDGIVATNTTLSREGLTTDPAVVAAAGEGGLSGAPLAARSLELLRVLRAAVPPSMCIISVGGVETGDDVAERLAAGATLVQGYTAFLYEGPLWAAGINRRLAELRRLARDPERRVRTGTGPA